MSFGDSDCFPFDDTSWIFAGDKWSIHNWSQAFLRHILFSSVYLLPDRSNHHRLKPKFFLKCLTKRKHPDDEIWNWGHKTAINDHEIKFLTWYPLVRWWEKEKRADQIHTEKTKEQMNLDFLLRTHLENTTDFPFSHHENKRKKKQSVLIIEIKISRR